MLGTMTRTLLPKYQFRNPNMPGHYLKEQRLYLLILSWSRVFLIPITSSLMKNKTKAPADCLLPYRAAPGTISYHLPSLLQSLTPFLEEEATFFFCSQGSVGNWRQQWNEIRGMHGIHSTSQWQAATSAMKYSNVLALFPRKKKKKKELSDLLSVRLVVPSSQQLSWRANFSRRWQRHKS